MKAIVMSSVVLALVGCGGGSGDDISPCASELEISQALLGSSLQWQGRSNLVTSVSGQVVIFDDANFQLIPGQSVQIQANVTVPAACRSGLRFSWGRNGDGSVRGDPAWLDVNPISGEITGMVPADIGDYSTGGSKVQIEMPGVKWRFLNFGINVVRQ
jgi:hypothetical protein